jgi:multidrug efflux pump subunit AcrA (membrane-fusion protein)
MNDGQNIRPVPDPTVLTTEASNRLEGMLRNLIVTEIAHQRELFTIQLLDLKERTAEQKTDVKDALNAALAAAKEQVTTQNLSFEKSIIKSETATAERIRALETVQQVSTSATEAKIADIKDRVVAIEAIKLGNTEGAATIHQGGVDSRAMLTVIIGAALACIALASLLIALLHP